jgi:hypothetical protein
MEAGSAFPVATQEIPTSDETTISVDLDTRDIQLTGDGAQRALAKSKSASRLRHLDLVLCLPFLGRLSPRSLTSYNLAQREGVVPRSECVGDAIGPFVSMLADLTCVVDTLYADALCLQAYHPVYSHANKVETT